ncbi:hypothetical protein [Mycobacterium sp. CnD-18-1]|uniref:hypothetical protein n=1 Tax=Mycobacterium sp. CnD-18-1 TaxID=2917744 RepID=UPI001EF1B902|nr:hypothetical protein [Mycobacterium sp. CnD-18-1]MCG7607158.1 hypothetical protein [Mycobacterium sp. CnD-18-1]
MSDTDAAKSLLESEGYVVLRRKSYEAAQRRQHAAECYKDAEIRAAESARAWALDCLTEERRLRDRCTFLYGVAKSMGATDEQLRSA